MGNLKSSPVDKWLEPDGLMLIECWARDYKKADIAHRMGINPTTLSLWKARYPQIDEALSKGAEVIDYKVENALLKSALGFTTKEIKVTLGRQVKNGKVYELTKEVITKEIAPSNTACAMWLNNRLPDKWKRNRDNNNIDIGDSNLTISVVRGPSSKDDEDEVNQSVQIRNGKGTEHSAISDEGKDYWPDDWEE